MDYAKTKPLQTIKEHTDRLIENLKIIKKLYEKEIVKVININKDRFWELLEIICIYHDIGKIYTPFQNIILKELGENTIKTRFSYDVIKHEQLSPMFIPTEKYKLTQEEKILVYQSIYYHHERKRKEINSTYVEEIIKEDIEPRIEKIKKEIGYEIKENLDISYIKYIKKRINEEDKQYIEYCLLKGLLHKLDNSSSAILKIEDDTLEEISYYVDEFIKNKKSKPNELQKFCKKNKNENLVVIGSTGIGKTEAALYWSSNGKTFFTLPVRTSINAIYDRIEDSIGYKHTGLLHSTALEYLEEKDELDNIEEKYHQTRNLCEKITTCTIDQIFPFVFKYPGYEKIYATLSYSKLIIDEVQAYSPQIVAVLIKGMEMINKIGGKFMLMTATLPSIYKKELEKRKIKFKFKEYLNQTNKRHKIKFEDKEIIEDLEKIKKKAKNKKILIIANTVNKAIEIYLKLKEKGTKNINLLHSRFIYDDRKDKERSIKKFSDKKCGKGIWITTQIVEASIDIDFDYLYTEMSTLDSLFQRLGRCYRLRDYLEDEENIHIYTKNVSGIGCIYDKILNKKSIKLLKKYDKKILTENTKVELVNQLYSEKMLEGTKFLERFYASINALENILDYKTSKKVAQKLFRNINNVRVIPKKIYEQNLYLFQKYKEENKDFNKKYELKRKIDKLTVLITQKTKWRIKNNLIENPYCKGVFIADLKYSDEVGLIIEKDEEYEIKV